MTDLDIMQQFFSYDLQQIYKTDTFLFQRFCVQCNCTLLVTWLLSEIFLKLLILCIQLLKLGFIATLGKQHHHCRHYHEKMRYLI